MMNVMKCMTRQALLVMGRYLFAGPEGIPVKRGASKDSRTSTFKPTIPLSKTIVHTCHRGTANYVFADGHASTESFGATCWHLDSRPTCRI